MRRGVDGPLFRQRHDSRTTPVFSFFKLLTRPCEERSAQSAARTSPGRPEQAAADDRRQDKELTAASWPPADRKPQVILWGGGCCG
jgi:hypothetical protein